MSRYSTPHPAVRLPSDCSRSTGGKHQRLTLAIPMSMLMSYRILSIQRQRSWWNTLTTSSCWAWSRIGIPAQATPETARYTAMLMYKVPLLADAHTHNPISHRFQATTESESCGFHTMVMCCLDQTLAVLS